MGLYTRGHVTTIHFTQRPGLPNQQKPTAVPRKLRATLTLNILKSVHTSNYPILLSELYTVATPKHSNLDLSHQKIIFAFSPLRLICGQPPFTTQESSLTIALLLSSYHF